MLAKSPPSLVAITKAAHGMLAILSVAISENVFDAEKIDISSTGRDGCICHHFHTSRASTEKTATMTSLRVEPVPGITVVEAVVTKQGMPEIEENDHERMAVDFSASDFLIWSLSSQLEVSKIRRSIYIVRCPILHIKKLLVVGRLYTHGLFSSKIMGEIYIPLPSQGHQQGTVLLYFDRIRNWHLLAVPCHHAAPVLSLARVIYSKKKHKVLNRQSQEDLLEGHRLEDLAFIVCSGATDGAAAIWDVTSSVKFFL
eukprot:SM000011S19171  [mRNA]  locus=s11:1322017:1325060:+ [translate_table: standard]